MNTFPFFGIARAFLFAALVSVVIVSTGMVFPFISGKMVWFRAAIDLSLLALCAGLVFRRDADGYWRRLVAAARSPIGIAVLAFTLTTLISGLFGVDPAHSFWSDFERGEGGLQTAHYALLFFLAATLLRDERDWRRIFVCSLVAAFLVIGYGVGASLKYTDAEIAAHDRGGWALEMRVTEGGGPLYQTFKNFAGSSWKEAGYRFQGSLGNPAYAAGYFLFALFYAFRLLSDNPPAHGTGRGRTLALLAVAGILLAVLVWTGTRAAFLGLGAGVAVFLFAVGLAHRQWRVRVAGVAVVLALFAALAFAFRGSEVGKRLPGARVLDISFSEETFRDRLITWDIAWKGFLDRPVLGWGPENFTRVFLRHLDPRLFEGDKRFSSWFDRPHNLFLDRLVATGVVGGISFVGLFAAFYWSLVRDICARRASASADSGTIGDALFFALPAAYLVQGFALFDVLPITLNLFLFLAFAAWRFAPRDRGSPSPTFRGESVAGRVFAGVFAVAAVAALVVGAILPWTAARRYVSALNALGSAKTVAAYEEQLDSFLRAPGPVGKKQMAGFAGSIVLGTLTAKEGQPEAVSRALAGYVEPFFSENDINHVLLRATLRAELWKRFATRPDFEQAETDFNRVLAMGPRIPQALYGLFELYQSAGDTERAAAVGERILAAWPEDESVRAAVR